jgi:capsular polysaccharide export protein
MDILFVSSKGSQYRYFKSLCRDLSVKCSLSTLKPSYALSIISTGLTVEKIRDGLAFHISRKQKKHYLLSKLPRLIWQLYWLRSALKFSMIYLRFVRYFQIYNPALVVVWNGHRLPEKAVAAAAQECGVKVAYFENGLLPNTTTFDFSGVNALNSVPREREFYLTRMNVVGGRSFLDESLVARAPHKKKKVVLSEEELYGRYIFVPFQVGFDSQVLINSPSIQSMEELYAGLELVLEGLNDLNLFFVVKEHPSDTRSYDNLYQKNSRIIFSSAPTEDLIRKAEAVITLNSSVGLEAIMFEKTVFVLGDACFAIDGISKPVGNMAELTFYINNLHCLSISSDLQRSFMTYLSDVYCIPGAWQNQCYTDAIEHVSAIERRIIDGLGDDMYEVPRIDYQKELNIR